MKHNFNLRDKKAKNKTIILLSLHMNGGRKKVSTKLEIKPSFWNFEKQEVKASAPNLSAQSINRQLHSIVSVLKDIDKVFRERADYYLITVDELLEELKRRLAGHQSGQHYSDFWRAFTDFLELKKKTTSHSTYKDYHFSLRKYLKVVQKKKRRTLTFHDFKNRPNNGYQIMVDYVTHDVMVGDRKGMSVNAVGKLVKCLKCFLNHCFNQEIYPSFPLVHMNRPVEEVEQVYLTHQEIERLEEIELTSKMNTIRDVFLIGCEVGQRFGDYSRLAPESISNGSLRLRQQKTLQKVVIPLSSRFKRIVEKNGGQPPQYKGSITEFNKGLRQICKMAGINDSQEVVRTYQNKQSRFYLKKYEMVSSHTARRSFCTLKTIDGMPSAALMKISGHKSERSFQRYLRFTGEEVAEKFKGYFK